MNDREPRFSIIDPNNPANDIAGGSGNTQTIVRCFSDAHKALKSRMEYLQTLPKEQQKGQSILGCIIEGDYSSFEHQRRHLKDLHG
jgi:non-canonical poly(A) RNA polymerase PAPD5/7